MDLQGVGKDQMQNAPDVINLAMRLGCAERGFQNQNWKQML
ncbi:hypothetical protein LINPERHAP2_LOCUS28806 [Linum perenne]